MKIYYLILIILFLDFTPGQKSYSEEKNINQISFHWALLNKKNNIIRSLDCRHEVKINKNDFLSFFIQPLKNAYIYLYLYDTEKKLYFLFPSELNDFKNETYYEKKFFIPKGDNYLIFKNQSGKIKFFLLASKSRLKNLEKLTNDYLRYTDNINKSNIRIEIAKQKILHYILELKHQFNQKRIKAETPVPFAGSIRGEKNNVQFEATLVQTDKTYVKTIYINKKINEKLTEFICE